MEDVIFLESMVSRDRQIASPVDPCYAIEIFPVPRSRNPYQNTLEVDSRKTQPTFLSVCLQNWDDLIYGTPRGVPED